MEFSAINIIAIVGILMIFCTLPFIIMGVVLYFAASKARGLVDQVIIPDLDALKIEVNELRSANSNLSDEDLARKIVINSALKAGLVGGLTGFGGAFTAIGLTPVDVTISLRIQASMIGLIAYIYNDDDNDDDQLSTDIYTILATPTTKSISNLTGQAVQQLVLQVLIRTLIKITLEFVPILGAFVGFGINAVITWLAGQLAIKWYKGELHMEKLKEDTTKTTEKARLISRQIKSSASKVTKNVQYSLNDKLMPADKVTLGKTSDGTKILDESQESGQTSSPTLE